MCRCCFRIFQLKERKKNELAQSGTSLKWRERRNTDNTVTTPCRPHAETVARESNFRTRFRLEMKFYHIEYFSFLHIRHFVPILLFIVISRHERRRDDIAGIKNLVDFEERSSSRARPKDSNIIRPSMCGRHSFGTLLF